MLPARFVPDVDVVVVVDEAGCWVKLGPARTGLAVVQARQVTIDWCSFAVRSRRETRAVVRSRASTEKCEQRFADRSLYSFAECPER